MLRSLASLVLGASLGMGVPAFAQDAPPEPTLEQRIADARAAEKEKRAALIGPVAFLTYETARWTDEKGQPIIKNANGTAVIIASRPKNAAKPEGPYENYALTVYHNVDTLKEGSTVSIDIFDPETRKRREYAQATIEKKDSVTRVAMLRFETPRKAPTAHLISREDISDLNVFREVYAIGCQYARPPYVTKGEITDTNSQDDEKFDAERYELWSTTAIIAEGMSGGAIYTDDTHELIGLIEAYEAEPTPIWEIVKDGKIPKQIATIRLRRPQSNLFVSPRAIYTFLKKNGYDKKIGL